MSLQNPCGRLQHFLPRCARQVAPQFCQFYRFLRFARGGILLFGTDMTFLLELPVLATLPTPAEQKSLF
jgi:hypothetical protein